MSSGIPSRTRSERVAQFELTPSRWDQLWAQLRRGDVLLRIALCAVAALIMWLATGAWNPAFPYREGMLPRRDIVAMTNFEMVDVEKTREARELARRRIEVVYRHDPQPLIALRSLLKDRVSNVLLVDSYAALDKEVWHELHPPPPGTNQKPPAEGASNPTSAPSPPAASNPSAASSPSAANSQDRSPTANSQSASAAPQTATQQPSPAEQQPASEQQATEGTTTTEPPATPQPATTQQATTQPAPSEQATTGQGATEPQVEGQPQGAAEPERVKSPDELVYEAFIAEFQDDKDLKKFEAAVARAFAEIERYGWMDKIEHSLDLSSETTIQIYIPSQDRTIPHVPFDAVTADAVVQLEQRLARELDSDLLARHIIPWVKAKLPITLKFDLTLTEEVAEKAARSVRDVMTQYVAGKDRLADRESPLDQSELALLRLEYDAALAQRPVGQIVAAIAGDFGMYVALYLLCGAYLYRRTQDLLHHIPRLIALQVVVVVAVVTAFLASSAVWRAEMIPLVLCAMTLVIAYRQELALLISAAVCLVVVMSLGYGLFEFVVLTATVSASILLLNRVRSRTKLIYVGLGAGCVALLTAMGAATMAGMSLGMPLFVSAIWYGFFAVVAGVLMTGLLPFIEQWLDVQTDLSLLELGDVAHPLLQELVRRAPGTYNHSINVASLGEAAAEAIGANGLLVRVGAYFHDIGKMLKPQYFIENQSVDGNCHEDLLPAMSTLIIIAHVKDGADLARQHHLPQCIVDFILQHHGTTLVEYFYDRASRQQKEDPDAGQVDEGSYRYPGPKPQTREAAVLMLADAVESASRTLHDPAPSRIENLVDQIAMKKLLDNQFDECGLTLQELREVQDSLVKSLTGMYHSRVKYPSRNTA